MNYTVKQLSKLAGVSVRTLHYYDEIGLLQPTFIKENGYRYYQQKELLKLQQILFFRELNFSLKDIKTLINAKNFDMIEALNDQRKLLTLEKERIEALLKIIDYTVRNLKGGEKMNDNKLYKAFTKKHVDEYREEAIAKWGEKAVRESEERIKGWSKEDFKNVQIDTDALMRSIVRNMDKGIQSPEVQADIEKYFESMQKFYDCTYEIFRGLGKMYVEDKRFTAFYDKYHPKLAQFMCDAMAYYCDIHEGKK